MPPADELAAVPGGRGPAPDVSVCTRLGSNDHPLRVKHKVSAIASAPSAHAALMKWSLPAKDALHGRVVWTRRGQKHPDQLTWPPAPGAALRPGAAPQQSRLSP